MATKKEVRARILKAINAKKSVDSVCPICNHNSWALGTGYVTMTSGKCPMEHPTGAERAFPLVPLLCTNCGNTQLLNLFYLGFTDNDWDSLRIIEDE